MMVAGQLPATALDKEGMWESDSSVCMTPETARERE